MYQTDWPVFTFMYEDLTDLVRKVLQLFMELDVLTKYASGSALKKLNLTKLENFLSRRKLNTRFATKLTVPEMISKDLVTDKKVSEFKK